MNRSVCFENFHSPNDLRRALDEPYYRFLRTLLEDNGVFVRTIANFGCSRGVETLVLAHTFEVEHAVGIDKDRNVLDAAERLLATAESIDMIDVGAERITFLEADITQTVALPDDHYDLAYCANVLCHICKNDRRRVEAVRSAVGQMSRVVKLGGAIVVVEGECCSAGNKSRAKVTEVLESVGLVEIVTRPEVMLHMAANATYMYVYRRPGYYRNR